MIQNSKAKIQEFSHFFLIMLKRILYLKKLIIEITLVLKKLLIYFFVREFIKN